MALLRSLPVNATLVELRRIYADLLEKLRPYVYDAGWNDETSLHVVAAFRP